MTDDRIGEIWRLPENYCKPLAFGRAIEAECRGVPDYVWMIGTKGFMALFATEEAANDWQQMNGTNTPASYIQPVSIPVISAAPKPDPERKHEIVPTLAEPSEYAKAFQDMITHGYSFMKDGMRIPPEDVIEPAEPDCECGAVASEHCPACEPVAQEPEVPMTPAASIFKDEVARLNAEVERLRVIEAAAVACSEHPVWNDDHFYGLMTELQRALRGEVGADKTANAEVSGGCLQPSDF